MDPATWCAIIAIVIAICSATYAAYSSVHQKNKVSEADVSDVSYTTVDESKPVPELFGARLLPLNLMWYGDFKSQQITIHKSSLCFSSNTKIGYSYYLGMLMVMATRVDILMEFRKNDVVKWSGHLSSGTFTCWTGDRQSVNPSKATKSDIVFYNGLQTDADSYLAEKTQFTGCYKHTSFLVMRQVFIGDGNTTVPTYTVLAGRWPDKLSTGKYQINYYLANAADVILYILEDLLNISNEFLDIASFTACEATLFSEGLGVAFAMSEAAAASEWIQKVLDHIDGILFFDEETGLMTMKLIRDDYVEENLEELTESDYAELEFSRGTADSIFSDLRITYTSRHVYAGTDDDDDDYFTWSDATYVTTNPAARASLGFIKEKTLDMKMFTDAGSVAIALTRLRRRYFYPVSTMTFECAPSVYSPKPGDVVKLTNANFGFSGMIIRITGVQRSDCRDEKITIEAMEDIFAFGSEEVQTVNQYYTEGSGVDWSLDDSTKNVPRYVTVKDALAEVATSGKSLMVIAAPPINGTVMGFHAYIGDQVVGTYDFCGTGTLAAQYAQGAPVDFSTAGFIASNPIGISSVTNSVGAWQRFGTMVMIDDGDDNWEIMSVRTIAELTNGTFLFTGVIRGVAGTKNMTHATGARVWILPEDIFNYDPIDVADQALNAPLTLTVQAFNIHAVSDDVSVAHTYGWRPETPYDPANVKGARSGANVTISWTACTRHKGAHNCNADTITAYDDDTEGSWQITGGGQTQYSTSPSITISNSASAQYTIKSYLNGRFSNGVTITV
jgi:hypothetical protein